MLDKLKTKTIVSPYEPLEFPAFDNDELAYKFEVVELANVAAKNNSPDESAQRLDSNELNFHHKMETHAQQATNKVRQSTEELRSHIAAININKEISEIDDIGKEFENKVSSDFSPAFTELEIIKKDVVEAESDLNTFKKANKLRRAADYPDSHALTVGILFLALLTESVMNGFFFAKGNDFGLVGGISTALIIALLNISMGFLNGWWFLRYKNHNERKWVYCSSVVFTVITAVSIVFNLLVAHYREALAINPDDAATLAISSFNEGILAISDVESWFLLLVGIIFFSLAVYKGYNLDDAYPGYGKLSRRRNRFLGDLDELRQEMLDDLNELHQEHLEMVEQKYEDIQRKNKQLSGLISTFEHQMGIYRSHIKNLQSNLTYIMATYRDVNTSARSTPKPAYFDSQYSVKFDLEEVSTDYNDKREEISSLVDELAKILPERRSHMLNSKEECHQKINEVTKL